MDYRQTTMLIIDRLCNQKGQGLVEYGLILTLASIVAITVLTSLGSKVVTLINKVAASF